MQNLQATQEYPHYRIERIITHRWPHLDEILAIILLMQEGKRKFPGISKARIEYSRAGEQPEGKSSEKHLEEGTLLIGLGGGIFDEHPTIEGGVRKKGESACSLVAKSLGIDKHPLYKDLVKKVTQADLSGVDMLHIANELKRRYRLNPHNQEAGIHFGQDCIYNLLEQQRLFLEAIKICQHPDRQALAVNFPCLKVIFVKSDNFMVPAAARYLKIDVVIQRNESGNVQIFTTSPIDIKMDTVACALRCAEIDIVIEELSEKELSHFSEDGKIPESPLWYLQVPGDNILNGSETTPDTPATGLKYHQIFGLVREYVRKNGKVE